MVTLDTVAIVVDHIGAMQPPVPDHHPERARDVIRRSDRCLVLKNQVDCSKPKVVNV